MPTSQFTSIVCQSIIIIGFTCKNVKYDALCLNAYETIKDADTPSADVYAAIRLAEGRVRMCGSMD